MCSCLRVGESNSRRLYRWGFLYTTKHTTKPQIFGFQGIFRPSRVNNKCHCNNVWLKVFYDFSCSGLNLGACFRATYRCEQEPFFFPVCLNSDQTFSLHQKKAVTLPLSLLSSPLLFPSTSIMPNDTRPHHRKIHSHRSSGPSRGRHNYSWGGNIGDKFHVCFSSAALWR